MITKAEEIIVEVASYHIARPPLVLECIGLGSCIGITLYDAKHNTGALAHAMLPRYLEGRDKNNGAKYVDSAIYLMVDDLQRKGSRKRDLVAKMVGGAQMFAFTGPETHDIGKHNIEVATTTLKKEGIPVKGKDVGGRLGRTIRFDLETGKIEIRKGKEIPIEI